MAASSRALLRLMKTDAPHPALDPHNVALAARVARESFGYSDSTEERLTMAYAANDQLTRQLTALRKENDRLKGVHHAPQQTPTH